MARQSHTGDKGPGGSGQRAAGLHRWRYANGIEMWSRTRTWSTDTHTSIHIHIHIYSLVFATFLGPRELARGQQTDMLAYKL